MGLQTQDFILGYFRFLLTGGMTAALTAAPESIRANRRLRRIQIKPLTQCPERRVNAVDFGSVLEIREAVHFLPRDAELRIKRPGLKAPCLCAFSRG
ncbi:MAG: hypothetical protein WAL75_27630 [Terracidiphilus sp.]